MLFTSRFEKTALALSVGFIVSGSYSLQAQESENTTVASEPSRVERIAVIGTRRSNIDELQASAPVDILSNEVLERTGAADIAAALRKLSPSFSLPSTPTGGFASSLPTGASLRGLSSDQVLVLVNGKRRHTGAIFTRQGFNGGRGSASVDLGLIPVSAVARVEILRDGAAAQYGSDALAGVINVVLRNNSEGGSLQYRYSEFIKRNDDDDGKHHQVNGWKGFELPNNGFLTFAFSASDRKLANNTDPDPRQFYNSLPNGEPDPREENHPLRNWKFGSPETKNFYNVLLNLEQPLSESAAIYGFATYSHKDTIGKNFIQLPRAPSLEVQSFVFQERFPDGRIPTTLTKLEDFAATAGIRWGEVDTGGQFDFYANYGENELDSYDSNGINPSYGLEGPTSLFTGTRENIQINTALDYTREIPLDFLAEPLTLAVGVSYRKEEYNLTAGDIEAYTRGPYYNASPVLGVGVPGIYSGITDQDEGTISRNAKGIYFSLETSPTDNLDLGLAFRTENYSDFGSRSTGKVSLRYEFNDTLALRSSAGTGYRAPSVVQLGFSAFSVQTQTNLPGFEGIPVDVQQRTLLPDSEAASLLGGKPLTPEKSNNISAGFVWTPSDNISITLDAYQIEIDERIQLSQNLPQDVVQNAFAGTPYANISNAAFFTNILDTRTRGFELSGRYEVSLNQYGNIDFTLGYTRNDTEITHARDIVTPNGDVVSSLSIINRSDRAALEEGTPEDKLILGANWKIDAWSFDLNARRYGKWSARINNATGYISETSRDQTFSAQIVFDLDIGYSFSGQLEGLRVNIGGQNIFDSYPDHIYGRGSSVTKFSFNSPEGSYGTLLYANVSYAF